MLTQATRLFCATKDSSASLQPSRRP
jgi:hypothetical protein